MDKILGINDNFHLINPNVCIYINAIFKSRRCFSKDSEKIVLIKQCFFIYIVAI